MTGASRGIALPAVLVTLAALAAIVTTILPRDRARTDTLAAVERRSRERLLLDAALARGLLALLAPDDPMTEALRQQEEVAWTFAGRELRIALGVESAKLDLNTADPGALAAVLSHALGSSRGAAALETALRERSLALLTSVDQILPLADRFSAAAVRLRDRLTVHGGLAEADAPVSERPVYTLRARLSGRAALRSQTVLIDPETRRFIAVERVDLEDGPNDDLQ
ncbi:hypothetical protein [Methylobacterium nonmethylotrophicum]|uniref:General secretion pathway protein GspK n=1 Tax=Methylobacterium nonmethylotrophicum TaxID=1141884 RepID=A0A4Z0NU30_9HYPH|nr:hypothetical protein [Methylobacterium nonmethylotrophicum]TGE01034.1 hypothetical protein EU555_05350 [Methylobacterium nonmethylotrophicum]